MGAAASIEQENWSEEDIVHKLLPHYVKHPEKCLRVHNALVQLVMLEKNRQLSIKLHEQDGALKDDNMLSRHQDEKDIEKERQLLAKKEQLEQEIIKKKKESLKDSKR